MKTFLKEPLLHFLSIGLLLFVVHAHMSGTAEGVATVSQVSVGEAEVRWLAETWKRQWQRNPTEDELRTLVTAYLKEELLAREAQRLGLDQGDPVVRRRLAGKAEFVIEESGALQAPSEIELQRYYALRAREFALPPRVSFAHVYFGREQRPDPAADATSTLALLARAADASTLSQIGDRLMFEAATDDVDEQTIARQFGRDFAEAVFKTNAGEWYGPFESPYGAHLVRVFTTQPARVPALEEVRGQVVEHWREEQKRTQQARMFQDLLRKYDVALEGSARQLVGALPASLLAGSEASPG